MTANAITLYRLFFTFIILAIFGRNPNNPNIDIACIAAIAIIFILDAVDGFVARRKDQATTFGAVFDIAADRVIENVFWIYFAVMGLIPVWMPIAVVTRGILTDGVRGIALTDGKTPFEMMSIPWTRALTSTRISRFFSGFSKALAFLFLATVSVLERTHPDTTLLKNFTTATNIIAVIAVAICLIRGFPVLVDGWKYIKLNT